MMLTYEETQRVYKWYCTVSEGDHQAKEILQSVGLISVHDDEIILCYSNPNTSFFESCRLEEILFVKN